MDHVAPVNIAGVIQKQKQLSRTGNETSQCIIKKRCFFLFQKIVE